jgi:uncharacterized membrane protein
LRVFEEKSASGLSDREIIEQLGNPSKIIKSYQKTPEDAQQIPQPVIEADVEIIDEKISVSEDESNVSTDITEEFKNIGENSSTENVTHSNASTSTILRFLLGLLIGLPILLVFSAIIIAGISVAALAFLQGLIMTFDLPYRIWQFPFTIREDFSLLVGIGLIMVGSGLVTLFLSAFVGIFHGFKNLFKGNFGSAQ